METLAFDEQAKALLERGLVDDVIDPSETREVLARSLAMLQTKHAELPSRKHGNPPQ